MSPAHSCLCPSGHTPNTTHRLRATRSQEPPCAPRRKSQQAEREYEKIKSQLEGLEESVRDRCKKEFTGRAAC